MTFENTAGLGVRQQYGPRLVDMAYGGKVGGVSRIKQGIWVVDFSDVLTQTAAGLDNTTNVVINGNTGTGFETVIPATSQILSCRLEVLTALASTLGDTATSASIQVGLIESDGTAIDLDGLIDATDGALTMADTNDIAEPAGSIIIGDGAAYIYGTAATPGTASVSTPTDGELYCAVVMGAADAALATLTGKIRIVVEWMES